MNTKQIAQPQPNKWIHTAEMLISCTIGQNAKIYTDKEYGQLIEVFYAMAHAAQHYENNMIGTINELEDLKERLEAENDTK